MLDAELEVDLETQRANGAQRRTTVWLVVDAGDVFIRSWRGEHGHWYREALKTPDKMAIRVAGRRLPVLAVHTTDADSVDRCSRALWRKYPRSPSTASMVAPDVLGTTLRLEPRDD